MTATDRTGADRSEAELVADAVTAVPGVFGLHAGAVGEAVTLLPGRRVPGIRITDEASEVHIAVEHGRPVREVADAVRQATRGVVDRPVTVVVEDIATPEPATQELSSPEAPASELSSSEPVATATDIQNTTETNTSAPTGAKERN